VTRVALVLIVATLCWVLVYIDNLIVAIVVGAIAVCTLSWAQVDEWRHPRTARQRQIDKLAK